MVALLEDGEIFARRLATEGSRLGEFASTADCQAPKRLLAMSATGRLIAICSLKVTGNYSISQNILECIGRDSKSGFFEQQLGSEVSITAAAFSSDETMLAVSTHNAQTGLDTTTIWKLSHPPEVVFSLEQDNGYTACLAFAMKDSILIQAGLHLRLWDISESTRTAEPRVARTKKFAAVKLSNDCSRIASICSLPDGIPRSLMIFSTDVQTRPIEIPLPTKTYDGSVELKNLLAYSANGRFLAWDDMILSTETNTLVQTVPLLSSETVYYVCGFSPDAKIAVYATVGSSESRKPGSIDLREDQRLFRVISYKWHQNDRRLLCSNCKVSIMRSHPLQPLIGLIGKERDDGSSILSIYNIESLHLMCKLSLVDQLPARLTIDDLTFTSGNSLRFLVTEEKWAAGDIKLVDIVYGGNVYDIIPRQYRINRSQRPQLLSSGFVVCILREGWVELIDETGTKRRVNYLDAAMAQSESLCTIGEINGFICLVVASRCASDWLYIQNLEIYSMMVLHSYDLEC